MVVDFLPEGGEEFLCPNCGWVMRKGEPVGDGGSPAADMTASASHLKIARTVNVGFGDFASVLAATNASRIVPADDKANGGPDRTRTSTGSTLTVEEPDDEDALSPLDIYDEDDEYARIQADIASRKASLDARAAELDAREKYLNRKLDEIIAEKEFLRTGIEKTDTERASYLKQKGILDIQRADMEKEMAARKASLDARAAEIERKAEALGKTRAALEDLRHELDASLTGDKTRVDHTSSSVSIPYSAKLLRQNNKLERTVRILTRILICLAALTVLLTVLLFVKDSELKRARAVSARTAEPAAISASAETEVPAVSEVAAETEKLSAPESATSGGGL
jgi:hypothetical protein